MRIINNRTRDYYGGALMILIGLYAAYKGKTYQIGTLTQMGPGFFPVVLGVLLIVVGAMIALSATKDASDENEAPNPPEWRGWSCILLSIVAFIVIGKYGGLLPATFAIVFISALGDRENTIKHALLLSAAMTVICLVIFWWALKLQFPLFQWGGS